MVEKIKNKFINDYGNSWSFSITLNDFYKDGSRFNYNKIIRNNIFENTHGVYLISDSNSKTILYVGMSGQIKRMDDGSYKNCQYDIRKRLVSSRGKQKNGKTDISSSDYFKDKMNKEDIQSITITILKTNNKISPTYLESCILQYYFNETDTLPIWNNSF